MIDFGPYRRKEQTLVDLAAGLGRADLVRLTELMCDFQLELLADIEDRDVVFIPDDPEANDTFAATPGEVGLSWTLAHVVVHTTASAEEGAFKALELARGVVVPARSRFEVPWQTVTTAAAVIERIRESRRMRLAMLDAWPDRPLLETCIVARDGAPPWNAVTRFMSGLAHDDAHLGQLRRITVEARAARAGG